MMDRFIIKIITALLFFIIPNSSFLKEIKYQADGKLPLEFIYIINSYQNYDLNEEEKKSFKKTIYFYEQSFRKISKEEQFQLIKSQIYKNIINLFPISYKQNLKVDIKEIKEKFKMRLESKIEDSFQKWLISALIRDITLSKKNKSLKQSGIYYSLFYNWNNLFNDSTVQDIDKKLKILSKNILSDLKSRLKDFLLISKNISLKDPKEFKLEEMIFFNIKNDTPSKKKKDLEKKSNVLKILEPINEESLILPGTIKAEDEWVPKDHEENININPPRPDPNYSPPKKLPLPANDW